MPFMILDAKGRATLPEEVRTALALESGDVVLLEATAHGTYELVPASIIPNDQLWFHHPDMRARLAESEADFLAGRSVSATTPDEAELVLASFKEPSALPSRRRSARKRAR
jgi:bifunctional DNA-binding transcriptional regulator/antitoxin component of YhaV-PrlF toxin-antitoxin module